MPGAQPTTQGITRVCRIAAFAALVASTACGGGDDSTTGGSAGGTSGAGGDGGTTASFGVGGDSGASGGSANTGDSSTGGNAGSGGSPTESGGAGGVSGDSLSSSGGSAGESGGSGNTASGGAGGNGPGGNGPGGTASMGGTGGDGGSSATGGSGGSSATGGAGGSSATGGAGDSASVGSGGDPSTGGTTGTEGDSTDGGTSGAAGAPDEDCDALPVLAVPGSLTGDDFTADFGEPQLFDGADCPGTLGAVGGLAALHLLAGTAIQVSQRTSERLEVPDIDLVAALQTACDSEAACVGSKEGLGFTGFTYTAEQDEDVYLRVATPTGSAEPYWIQVDPLVDMGTIELDSTEFRSANLQAGDSAIFSMQIAETMIVSGFATRGLGAPEVGWFIYDDDEFQLHAPNTPGEGLAKLFEAGSYRVELLAREPGVSYFEFGTVAARAIMTLGSGDEFYDSVFVDSANPYYVGSGDSYHYAIHIESGAMLRVDVANWYYEGPSPEHEVGVHDSRGFPVTNIFTHDPEIHVEVPVAPGSDFLVSYHGGANTEDIDIVLGVDP